MSLVSYEPLILNPINYTKTAVSLLISTVFYLVVFIGVTYFIHRERVRLETKPYKSYYSDYPEASELEGLLDNDIQQ